MLIIKYCNLPMSRQTLCMKPQLAKTTKVFQTYLLHISHPANTFPISTIQYYNRQA